MKRKNICSLALTLLMLLSCLCAAYADTGSVNSKSTVHKDITERLRWANPQMYGEVRKILDTNKQERHIRGGLANKHKYEQHSK